MDTYGILPLPNICIFKIHITLKQIYNPFIANINGNSHKQ